MLRLALGYLAVAIVVAIGFSSLPDDEGTERSVASPAAKHRAKSAPGLRAYEDQRYDGSHAEDDQESEEADLEYVVEAGSGGHFVVEAVVNGAPVTFLVDTGASSVVLTMEDAERLGFRPENLRFTERFASANGEVRGAPVVLRELRIGQFSVFDMPASVNEAPLAVSLLGMSFLERLNGYGVEDGRLILRW